MFLVWLANVTAMVAEVIATYIYSFKIYGLLLIAKSLTDHKDISRLYGAWQV